MAIFARKQSERRASAKRMADGPPEASDARQSVDIKMDDESRDSDAAAAGTGDLSSQLSNSTTGGAGDAALGVGTGGDARLDASRAEERIVTATPIESVVGTPSVVASGVVEPAIVEPLDIESVDIEPEAIEPGTESNGALAFGIGDAIRLMRSLPADPNVDLVVRVVRVTLGAVNVSVDDIMQDAAKKEKEIQDNIVTLQSDAEELEKKLYAKRCEIAAHEADLKETVTVRERLHMADKYSGHRPPPTPPDAAKSPHVPGHPRPSEWAAEWERNEQLKADLGKG